MIVLALDSATPFLALALLDSDGPLALGQTLAVGRGHAEAGLAALASLLAEAEAQLGQPLRPTRLVVGTGPGSYTGLRIGASLALGLARAWGAEVVGVPSLQAIAASAADGEVAVSWDARKGQVYSASYQVTRGWPQLRSPIAKRSRNEYETLAAGLVRLDDCAPDPLALARLGSQANGGGTLNLLYL
jgi:tRNA threonylcarbamoyladenosine biosynthesis protein TsaB